VPLPLRLRAEHLQEWSSYSILKVIVKPTGGNSGHGSAGNNTKSDQLKDPVDSH
jgi:hypothetical protein